ncbi:sigma-54-dependent transcriptional regulator [Stagnihabitans tardus]|uniref:Nif-specific regulatory protein n=1 Tax=Stagnihabitans tardus TaxID=2699202 RepID=A0AAE4YBT7_9RHOB|nr:sigma-54 dependent transcriptional regulator [Stagnihabitans tardus]NBZ88358.1 response regulator [Stagnihabitans tardus]
MSANSQKAAPRAAATKTPAAKPALAKAGPILLIEDTASLQLIYRSVLAAEGYEVHLAASAAEGHRLFASGNHRVVLLDLGLPDGDGLQVMTAMLERRPNTKVIVITAHGSINRAVEAMRAGAHEFLVKPFEDARFLSAVANAVARSQSRKTAGDAAAGFIGSSEVMGRIHDKIASVAGSMATVFITGESGTGKELAALAVHGASPRAKGPFIALNCGAIPHDLLESEVFGHMKGSFTGAISDRPGAATAADGGTLFLDEICEMAPALQTKLLRFLQTSSVLPVGATKPIKVDVRIVCATNRDPLDAVRRGQFREDLYYRLFVVPIHLPPLRERGEDVIEIAETMLARFAEEEGRRFDGLDPEVAELFLRHPWPGNVRQLLNVIRNVVVLNRGGSVTLDMLPETLTDLERTPSAPPVAAPGEPTLDSLMDRPLAEVERLVVMATIARHGGSIPKAARVLDLSPSTLYRKLEAWSRED